MRCPVTQILGILFSILFFYASVQSADKIRIGYPGPSAQFIPLQLAQSNGFLRDEGLDAEIIQIAGNVAISALVNGALIIIPVFSVVFAERSRDCRLGLWPATCLPIP
jgi:ABC-type nitrate/sulfonate/bicarbonate transport system substrate-binding protein